jgi:hypothetical protein
MGLTMSEPQLTSETIDPLGQSPKARFLFRQLPYITALALAIFGVAYTNLSGRPLNGFWEFMAGAMGFVCVATGWPSAPDRQARLRLIWTQAAHWATILVAMNLVLMTGFQQLLPVPATGLVLLMLLALGTFLAGINLLSLQICFLGLAMALSIPAIAWLKQASLLLLLAGVAVAGLAIAFWPRGSKNST